jgi:hypothetical protein
MAIYHVATSLTNIVTAQGQFDISHLPVPDFPGNDMIGMTVLMRLKFDSSPDVADDIEKMMDPKSHELTDIGINFQPHRGTSNRRINK